MYKLGYLDDDKGNRTSFARQFEKDFDLDVIEDLNEVWLNTARDNDNN